MHLCFAAAAAASSVQSQTGDGGRWSWPTSCCQGKPSSYTYLGAYTTRRKF